MHDLLLVGDLHLGRVPTRIPASLVGAGGLRALGPRAALDAMVDLARAERVLAVVLAGDVIDAENQYLEAIAPLGAAVRALAADGIATVAVVGNHDAASLPRAARRIPGLRLLGEGGRWEHLVLARDGDPVVRLLGWSFPATRHHASPLDSLPAEVRERRFGDGLDVPVVGVLHCDLDATASAYAPVGAAALAAAGADLWALGHVHAASPGGVGAVRGYLGAACACDPGETGPHGPWLLGTGGDGLALRHVPLSPVRYVRADVALDGAADAAAVEDALVDALRDVAGRLDDPAGIVAVRLRAVGRVGAGIAAAIEAAARRPAGALAVDAGGAMAFAEAIEDATRPALDLDSLAAVGDPRGAIARTLLALQRGGPEADALLRSARASLDTVARRSVFARLDRPDPDDDAVREALARAARDALEALLATAGDAA